MADRSSCDFAVDGSPTINILTSPLNYCKGGDEKVMSEWYKMGYFTKGAGTKIRLGHWSNFYEVFKVCADRQAFVGPPFVSLVCRIEANEQMAAIIRSTSASEVSVGSTADSSFGGVADERIQHPLAEWPRIARVSNSVIF